MTDMRMPPPLVSDQEGQGEINYIEKNKKKNLQQLIYYDTIDLLLTKWYNIDIGYVEDG